MQGLKKAVTALGVLMATVAAQGFGLGETPPMGWNSWNVFGCDVNETAISQQAAAMAAAKLPDQGYKYIIIDDCWQAPSRNNSGFLVPDPVRFPNGIKPVADYIHNLNLSIGIYSSAGYKTCAGFPGSLGFETQDA